MCEPSSGSAGRSDHPSPEELNDECSLANNQDGPQLTLLWGTWELWADITFPPLNDLPGGSSQPHSGGHLLSDPSPSPESGCVEKRNWLDQVRSVGLLDSIEGFWGMHDCLVLPSQLPPNSSYYLFRKHIAPMWEHEANRRGGKWVMSFTASSPPLPPCAGVPHESEVGEEGSGAENVLPVDVAWQRLCLACLGEMLPGAEEEICGVTVTRGKVRAGSSAQHPLSSSSQQPSTSSAHHLTGHSNSPSSSISGGGEWKLCLWTRNAENQEAQRNIATYIKEELLGGGGGDGSGDATTEGGVDSEKAHYHRGGSIPPLVFMGHRDLMQAKEMFAKGIVGTPLKPRYVV